MVDNKGVDPTLCLRCVDSVQELVQVATLKQLGVDANLVREGVIRCVAHADDVIRPGARSAPDLELTAGVAVLVRVRNLLDLAGHQLSGMLVSVAALPGSG